MYRAIPVTAPDQEVSQPVTQQQLNAYVAGDAVWIYQPTRPVHSSKFAEDWSGQWHVTQILSERRLMVQRGDGKGRWDIREVHVNRVKPYSAPLPATDFDHPAPAATHQQSARSSVRQQTPLTTHRNKRSRAEIIDKIVYEAHDDLGNIWYQVRWLGCPESQDSPVPEGQFIERGVKNAVLTRWQKKIAASS